MLATTERQEHEPPSAPAAIAEELAALIAHAEEPSRLSKRDGRLLPLVPPSERVDASPELLRRSGALLGGAWEVAALVTSVRRACAGCTTTTAKRAVAAWARSLVYLEVSTSRDAAAPRCSASWPRPRGLRPRVGAIAGRRPRASSEGRAPRHGVLRHEARRRHFPL